MKYRPNYPERPFASLEQARAWIGNFVRWYNFEHRHSAIGFVTPQERHSGIDGPVLARRRRTYAAAHSRNPQRWSRHVRPWTTPATVTLNPVDSAHLQRASA